MSDTVTPVIADAVIAQVATMAPEAKSAAREQYAKHYGPDELNRAFGPAPSSPATGNNVGRTVLGHATGLSFGQIEQGLASLFKHGSVETQAKAIEMARAQGIDPLKITGGQPVPEPVSRDAQLEQHVTDAFRDPNGIPNDPSGYKFDFNPEAIAGIDPVVLQDFKTTISEAFHAAAVPQSHAQPLIDAMDTAADLYPEGQTDEARRAVFEQEGLKLRNAYGNVAAEQLGADADKMIATMPESFQHLAADNHIFHSANSVVALANAWRASQARK